MQQVPSRGRVIGQDVDVDILATPSTLPGVQPSAGESYIVLLFPDGEIKYYQRSAVETIEWRPS